MKSSDTIPEQNNIMVHLVFKIAKYLNYLGVATTVGVLCEVGMVNGQIEKWRANKYAPMYADPGIVASVGPGPTARKQL